MIFAGFVAVGVVGSAVTIFVLVRTIEGIAEACHSIGVTEG